MTYFNFGRLSNLVEGMFIDGYLRASTQLDPSLLRLMTTNIYTPISEKVWQLWWVLGP